MDFHELYLDILRHEVFIPREHYFIYKVHPELRKSLFFIVYYDGSSASANLIGVSWSYRKIMRIYKEYVKGLKPRYDWL